MMAVIKIKMKKNENICVYQLIQEKWFLFNDIMSSRQMRNVIFDLWKHMCLSTYSKIMTEMMLKTANP